MDLCLNPRSKETIFCLSSNVLWVHKKSQLKVKYPTQANNKILKHIWKNLTYPLFASLFRFTDWLDVSNFNFFFAGKFFSWRNLLDQKDFFKIRNVEYKSLINVNMVAISDRKDCVWHTPNILNANGKSFKTSYCYGIYNAFPFKQKFWIGICQKNIIHCWY